MIGALVGSAVFVSLPAPPAAARPARPSQAAREARKLARTLYLQAERKYSVGEFKEALRLFSKAYEVLPLPGFLFNIGQCERMLRRYKKAIFLYQRYLQKKPDAPNRALVERLLGECKGALEKERLRKLEEARRREAAMRRVVVTPPKPYLPPNGRGMTDSPPVYKRWWFWTALGVGVAAVVTGLAVGLSGGTRAPDPGSLTTVDLRTVR